jgi:dipeptidyl aminopeptidase/acylaminoacyl peptidase
LDCIRRENGFFLPPDLAVTVVQVRLYLPPDFSENKKYALVINVYGGPNSQQVLCIYIYIYIY